MRRGMVRKCNLVRGMVAIETSDDRYTIVELLCGNEIDFGDQIEWRTGHDLGGAEYFNRTRGETLDVYVHNHGVNEPGLDLQLQLEFAHSAGVGSCVSVDARRSTQSRTGGSAHPSVRAALACRTRTAP
jgi:hypothetical protein